MSRDTAEERDLDAMKRHFEEVTIAYSELTTEHAALQKRMKTLEFRMDGVRNREAERDMETVKTLT